MLALPIRPRQAADAALRPFGEPEAAPDTPSVSEQADPALVHTLHRDLLSGRSSVTFPRRNRRVVLSDIGLAITSRGYSVYAITEGDPLSAETVTEFDVTHERPGTVIRHRSASRLTCNAMSFRIEASLELHENGELFFARRWDETIPRDMM